MTQRPRGSWDPAPALPALHDAQARDGRLTRQGLEEAAASLGRSVVDLHQAATFYHYFGVGDAVPPVAGVCRGPACSLRGRTSDGPSDLPSIPCPGLCDSPVAGFEDGRYFPGVGGDGAFALPHPVDTEEALFRDIRAPGLARLATYRDAGGYRRLLDLVSSGAAKETLDVLEASRLVGRGGAGFPLAAKWRAVRAAQGTPKYVVCNADEGEPGTFKDRPLLHLNPHLLLEAMAVAGYVTGAETGIVYLRYEYPEALDVLERAIVEAEAAGLLGDDIAGTGFAFRVHIRRGAGSYVCGEETALLNSLEGRVPWPRERPPFPTTYGLWGQPTVVNNVETLCHVPGILKHGADWFRALGRGENTGTKLYSVSGAVRRPGNYELPLGITARELIFRYAGGPASGRAMKGFTLGGISGGLLGAEALDMPLDYTAPQAHGAALGSGGVIVLDDGCCVVDFARSCLAFYEAESCGKCFPCRVGTVRLREWLDGLTGRGELLPGAGESFREVGGAMRNTSACGLGQAAPLVIDGMLRHFADEVAAHVEGRRCPAGVCKP